jgi:lipopolysaccharide transport system permease protein
MKKRITLLTELWNERGAVWRLFKNDLRAKTRVAGASFLWNFILPIVPLGFYILLSQINVFPKVDGMSRLTFVSIGVTLWLLFSGFIMVPMNGLEGALRDLSNARLSVLSQLFVRLNGLIFDTLVRVVFVTFILIFASEDNLEVNLLFIPFTILVMLLCFGLGIILGTIKLVMGDVGRIVTIILQYGIFVSGVIFPISRLGELGVYLALNPLFLAIQKVRFLIVSGGNELSFVGLSWIGSGLLVFAWAFVVLNTLKDELKGRL